MFKIILPVLCMLSPVFITAQSYAFKMYFEDAMGNRDTIEFGFNPQSTLGIDESLGEINIIDEPFGGGLEVRIMDRWLQMIYGGETSFHAKKQVLPRLHETLNVIIKTDHFPVTASWDQQLINSIDTIAGSFLTSINPGGWFDTSSPSDLGVVNLADSNSVTFSSNLDGEYIDAYGYIINNDTMPTYWFHFDSIEPSNPNSTTDLLDLPNALVYPNPTYGEIAVENDLAYSIKAMRLYHANGEFVKSVAGYQLNFEEQVPGVYLLQILTKDSKTYLRKIVKY